MLLVIALMVVSFGIGFYIGFSKHLKKQLIQRKLDEHVPDLKLFKDLINK